MKLSSVLPDKFQQGKSKLPMGSLYKDLLAYGKGLPASHREQPTSSYDFVFSNTLRSHGEYPATFVYFARKSVCRVSGSKV